MFHAGNVTIELVDPAERLRLFLFFVLLLFVLRECGRREEAERSECEQDSHGDSVLELLDRLSNIEQRISKEEAIAARISVNLARQPTRIYFGF